MLLPLHLNLAAGAPPGGGGHEEPPTIRSNLLHDIVHVYADPDMVDRDLVRAFTLVLLFLLT